MNHHDDAGGGASRSTDPAAGSSAATNVSLREFVMAVRHGDLRSVLLAAVALVGFGAFAWSEIQRRLEILNHENARLLAQQEKTVSHDTYAANESQRKGEQADLNEWRKIVDADRTQTITRDEFQKDNRADRRGALASGTALAGVGVAVFVALLLLLTYIAARHVDKPTPSPPVVTVKIVPSK